MASTVCGIFVYSPEPPVTAGNRRIHNSTIDLGAYEETLLATFAFLYPDLDPNDDENNNGKTNYFDYALGGDPTGPDEQSLQPTLNGNELNFTYRNNASDVFVIFQKSSTLEEGSWTTP